MAETAVLAAECCEDDLKLEWGAAKKGASCYIPAPCKLLCRHAWGMPRRPRRAPWHVMIRAVDEERLKVEIEEEDFDHSRTYCAIRQMGYVAQLKGNPVMKLLPRTTLTGEQCESLINRLTGPASATGSVLGEYQMVA